jgi:hypothetical protein
MLTITCASREAAQPVREVFRSRGVNMNLVRDITPQADSSVYFLKNYRLDVAGEVRIRAEVSQIAADLGVWRPHNRRSLSS